MMSCTIPAWVLLLCAITAALCGAVYWALLQSRVCPEEKCWKVITSPCLAAQKPQTEPQTDYTQQKMVKTCHGLNLAQQLQRLNLAALAVPVCARPRGPALCGSGRRRSRGRPPDDATPVPQHPCTCRCTLYQEAAVETAHLHKSLSCALVQG